MCPYDVRHIAGEGFVVLGSEPIGQGLTVIQTRDIGSSIDAQKLRRHRTPAKRMLDFADTCVEDRDFPRVGGLFISHLAKESRKAVIVVHRPTVERMVVALGA